MTSPPAPPLIAGETLSPWDAAGGALIVGACVVNSLEPAALRSFLSIPEPDP